MEVGVSGLALVICNKSCQKEERVDINRTEKSKRKMDGDY